MIAGVAQRSLRKGLLLRLQLLQAHRVRTALGQPAEQDVQPLRDAVAVVGRDPHGAAWRHGAGPAQPPWRDGYDNFLVRAARPANIEGVEVPPMIQACAH